MYRPRSRRVKRFMLVLLFEARSAINNASQIAFRSVKVRERLKSEGLLNLNKAIDGLHLRNHKNESRHKNYNPSRIAEMYPDLAESKNTMAAEQTFVWLGRLKKIMSSMGKTHHLFYLHRMVQRRNRYTSHCYKQKRKPLLPKLRNEHST